MKVSEKIVKRALKLFQHRVYLFMTPCFSRDSSDVVLQPCSLSFSLIHYFFKYFYFIRYYCYNIGLFILVTLSSRLKKNLLHAELLTARVRIYEMRGRKNFGNIRRACWR